MYSSDSQCLDVSSACAYGSGLPTEFYQYSGPTLTSDRVCAEISEYCPDTHYQGEGDGPTPFSDRVCTSLNVCGENEYESVHPARHPDEYYTSNRGCATLSPCEENEYQSISPGQGSDRVCTFLTVCTDTQYESTEPTDTSDRVCSSLTPCSQDQYEYTPPGNTSDRECRELTTCLETEYQLVPPTATSDRECRPRSGYCFDNADDIEDVICPTDYSIRKPDSYNRTRDSEPNLSEIETCCEIISCSHSTISCPFDKRNISLNGPATCVAGPNTVDPLRCNVSTLTDESECIEVGCVYTPGSDTIIPPLHRQDGGGESFCCREETCGDWISTNECNAEKPIYCEYKKNFVAPNQDTCCSTTCRCNMLDPSICTAPLRYSTTNNYTDNKQCCCDHEGTMEFEAEIEGTCESLISFCSSSTANSSFANTVGATISPPNECDNDICEYIPPECNEGFGTGAGGDTDIIYSIPVKFKIIPSPGRQLVREEIEEIIEVGLEFESLGVKISKPSSSFYSIHSDIFISIGKGIALIISILFVFGKIKQKSKIVALIYFFIIIVICILFVIKKVHPGWWNYITEDIMAFIDQEEVAVPEVVAAPEVVAVPEVVAAPEVVAVP